jgi:cytochrome b subunit of formate dehydrogenase
MRRLSKFPGVMMVALVVAVWWATGRLTAIKQVAAQEGQTKNTVTESPKPDAAQSAAANPSAKPTLQCQGCHGAGRTIPYLGSALFHVEAHKAHDQNVHGRAILNGKKGATCVDCHSANGKMETVFPQSDARSAINRVNIAATCGKCHDQQTNTFHDSIHGQGLARGINTAATCSDCHGSHNILPTSDPLSQLSHANTPETCAKCHTTIRSEFELSAHHKAWQEGNASAPVCTTCHTAVAHAKAPATLRDFDVQIVQTCVACHEKQGPSYRDTFHGQSSALGFRPAATCVDCHTPHSNLPPSDPRSSVNSAHLIQTCGRCHQNATASFVTYDPHAEPTDRHRSLLVYASYSFMTLLFIGVFGFFGIHTLLWLQRSIVGLIRGETHRIRDGEQWVVRFNKSNRLTHLVMVVSFLVLAATGLPLMYYYTGWGQLLARVLGGVGLTRLLHRIFAVVTFGYAFYHLGYLLWLLIVKRERGILFGPESMVPRKKDFQDFWHMVRWFLYRDKRPPKLDRWTYWEKFDYFAVFWGIPIIGLSGLMLWFPGFFTGFLPGSFLNVAMIIHGEEALLATGFIFAFHFFHNHMRPENFPLDTVIFTGKLPLKRFEEERPKEYERLVAEGRLEEILTDPPSRRARIFATVFGFLAYIVGLILVIAIFATLIRH